MMTQSETIRFADPKKGQCSATVQTTGGDVTVTMSGAADANYAITLPSPAALALARAILAAAGETSSRKLPHSRQIGGIIGPY